MVDARDGEALVRLCESLEHAGADWIDLNPGRLREKERADVWRFLVTGAESACDCTLMIDTPDAEDMIVALKMCTRPPVLNFATAERVRLGAVLDVAAHHDLAVIAATMTDHVPLDAPDRLSLASVIVEAASKRGIEGERLILDPMIMPIGFPDGERHAHAVIEVIRALPLIFDPVPMTIAALGNLTTRSAGGRSREAAAPYLAALFGAGLDVALMDCLDDDLLEAARMCRVFGAERIFASSRP